MVGQPSLIAAYAKVHRTVFQKQKLTVSESPYTFSGSKGIEFRGTGDTRLVSRLFFVGYRFFAITVSDSKSEGFERQTKILDSFRLLTKAETIAALKWENDIEPVLQARPAILLGNDIQAAGLKGNVCSAIDEVWPKSSAGRDLDRESYYDPSGNLLREVTYNQGYPQEITQWGWIDGKRISSTRTIFYLPPEGMAWTAPMALGPITGMMGQQERGKIYGMRHEFIYDNKGRISEYKALTNERALKWTKKFSYSAAGREILTLDSTGGFLTRVLETFDGNGNIAEYKILDMTGKPFLTVRHTYEFDQGENWIVRRSYPVGAGPAKKSKPASTTFRRITYCDARVM